MGGGGYQGFGGVWAHLVNPQLPHDDVVHGGGHLAPHVVVPAGVELQVNRAWRERENSTLYPGVPKTA